jgi:hypothetical protein
VLKSRSAIHNPAPISTNWFDAKGVQVFEGSTLVGVSGKVELSEYDDPEQDYHETHFGWNVDGIPLIDLLNDGYIVMTDAPHTS